LTPAHEKLYDHVCEVIPSEHVTWSNAREFFHKHMHQWHTHSHTWRLNDEGVLLFKKVYAYNEYTWPSTQDHMWRLPWVLVGLRKHVKSPHHVSHNKFTVFDREICLEIEVCGDVHVWAQQFLK
jgi:hypothetical protein